MKGPKRPVLKRLANTVDAGFWKDSIINGCYCQLGDYISPKKYVNIPSGKYIYVHKYVYICVYTYLCKMDKYRHNAGLS